MTDFYEIFEKMKQAFESDKNYFFTFKALVSSIQTNVRAHAFLILLRKLSENILD